MVAFTSKNLVAVVLGTIASLAFFSIGCSREEAPAAAPAAPEAPVAEAPREKTSRLADPVYKAAIDDHMSKQQELRMLQSRLAERLRAKVNAMRESLGVEDEAAIKAALEKDPEFKSLQSRMIDAGKALRDEQRHATETVRAKIVSGSAKEGK